MFRKRNARSNRKADTLKEKDRDKGEDATYEESEGGIEESSVVQRNAGGALPTTLSFSNDEDTDTVVIVKKKRVARQPRVTIEASSAKQASSFFASTSSDYSVAALQELKEEMQIAPANTNNENENGPDVEVLMTATQPAVGDVDEKEKNHVTWANDAAPALALRCVGQVVENELNEYASGSSEPESSLSTNVSFLVEVESMQKQLQESLSQLDEAEARNRGALQWLQSEEEGLQSRFQRATHLWETREERRKYFIALRGLWKESAPRIQRLLAALVAFRSDITKTSWTLGASLNDVPIFPMADDITIFFQTFQQDVAEEYASIRPVLEQFASWKQSDPEGYAESFAHNSLQTICTHYLKLELLRDSGWSVGSVLQVSSPFWSALQQFDAQGTKVSETQVDREDERKKEKGEETSLMLYLWKETLVPYLTEYVGSQCAPTIAASHVASLHETLESWKKECPALADSLAVIDMVIRAWEARCRTAGLA